MSEVLSTTKCLECGSIHVVKTETQAGQEVRKLEAIVQGLEKKLEAVEDKDVDKLLKNAGITINEIKAEAITEIAIKAEKEHNKRLHGRATGQMFMPIRVTTDWLLDEAAKLREGEGE